MRNIIIACLVSSLVGAAFGYYLMPDKIKTEVRTETVTQCVEKSSDKKDNLKTVIVQKKNGDSITTITENSDTKTVADSQTAASSTDSTYEKISHGSKVSLSALVGTSVSSFPISIYGIAVSRELLGPVTVGAWGLTDKTFGASIGLNF